MLEGVGELAGLAEDEAAGGPDVLVGEVETSGEVGAGGTEHEFIRLESHREEFELPGLAARELEEGVGLDGLASRIDAGCVGLELIGPGLCEGAWVEGEELLGQDAEGAVTDALFEEHTVALLGGQDAPLDQEFADPQSHVLVPPIRGITRGHHKDRI